MQLYAMQQIEKDRLRAIINERADNWILDDSDGDPVDAAQQTTVDKLPIEIVSDIRRNMGSGEDDTSVDDEINQMNADELFERWCAWHGFGGWSTSFIVTWEALKEATGQAA